MHTNSPGATSSELSSSPPSRPCGSSKLLLTVYSRSVSLAGLRDSGCKMAFSANSCGGIRTSVLQTSCRSPAIENIAPWGRASGDCRRGCLLFREEVACPLLASSFAHPHRHSKDENHVYFAKPERRSRRLCDPRQA